MIEEIKKMIRFHKVATWLESDGVGGNIGVSGEGLFLSIDGENKEFESIDELLSYCEAAMKYRKVEGVEVL